MNDANPASGLKVRRRATRGTAGSTGEGGPEVARKKNEAKQTPTLCEFPRHHEEEPEGRAKGVEVFVTAAWLEGSGSQG
jgi:hypothetical protein